MVQYINAENLQPLSGWDTTFDTADVIEGGDWSIVSGPGMVGDEIFHTSVILQLFTDKRAPDDRDLPSDTDDRSGWWGDYVDVQEELYEQEIGSLIWLYKRSYLTEQIADRIRYEAEVALQVILDQGAASRIDVVHEWDQINQWIVLNINIFSRDGELAYSQKFHRLWQQIAPELG